MSALSVDCRFLLKTGSCSSNDAVPAAPGRFGEMVKDRTYATLESRAKERKVAGGRSYGYRDGKIDKGEAYIVRECLVASPSCPDDRC
jgi:hypothetical protein